MSAWERAMRMAAQTPESRNRYVDLLRAISIGAVVFGHWLIAAPWVDGDALRLDHMLGRQPWTQWLTLIFQVMPVFFLVGGYSNAASWDTTLRRGTPYGTWVAGRMRRLAGPVLPLIGVWALLGIVLRLFGVRPDIIRVGSQAALVPLWFLAVYILVVLLVPLTRAAWLRYGIASFWVPVVAAVAVDWLRFHDGHRPAIGWVNYVFVWVAVHQLGYQWRDGRLAGPRQALPWALGGATAWALLALFGPYPISMVGVPGEEVSNTLPPSVMLLALGSAQAGLLLALERPARRLLSRTRVWAATVLVNANIMSVYLWHLTAMVVVVGVSNLFGGYGLHLEPGSPSWWATRPLWIALLAIVLLLLLVPFGRFERLPESGATPPGLARVLVGAAMVCTALAVLALRGIGGTGGLVLSVSVLALALIGAWLSGVFAFGRTGPG